MIRLIFVIDPDFELIPNIGLHKTWQRGAKKGRSRGTRTALQY
jgi:hypothetical protein